MNYLKSNDTAYSCTTRIFRIAGYPVCVKDLKKQQQNTDDLSVFSQRRWTKTDWISSIANVVGHPDCIRIWAQLGIGPRVAAGLCGVVTHTPQVTPENRLSVGKRVMCHTVHIAPLCEAWLLVWWTTIFILTSWTCSSLTRWKRFKGTCTSYCCITQ